MFYKLIRIVDEDLITKKVEYEILRKFNTEEKEYIDACISNVHYFQVFAFSWSAILNNLKDLKVVVDEFASQYENTLSGSRDRATYVTKVAEVVRSASNFLSSANMFLALIEAKFFCNETKDKWVSKKRNLHADNLCYRLCYELRNHSQHAGLPISGVQANDIGLDSAHGEIYLEKELILSDKKSTEKLRKYISEYEGDISLIPIFDSYSEILKQLFMYFIELSDQYYKSIPEFYDRYSKYQRKNSSLIYVSGNVPNNEILLKMTRLQLGTFQWMLELTKNKNI
ncbi:hypothetical protein ACK323_03545 [Aeromonas enteropelogenes]|uniref:hypothetical protein n=1 Tax=Aeromonas enteropelogenes TaxID=29489 RepID=UPI0039896992